MGLQEEEYILDGEWVNQATELPEKVQGYIKQTNTIQLILCLVATLGGVGCWLLTAYFFYIEIFSRSRGWEYFLKSATRRWDNLAVIITLPILMLLGTIGLFLWWQSILSYKKLNKKTVASIVPYRKGNDSQVAFLRTILAMLVIMLLFLIFVVSSIVYRDITGRSFL